MMPCYEGAVAQEGQRLRQYVTWRGSGMHLRNRGAYRDVYGLVSTISLIDTRDLQHLAFDHTSVTEHPVSLGVRAGRSSRVDCCVTPKALFTHVDRQVCALLPRSFSSAGVEQQNP
jgi:hypothetical protein